MSNFSQSENAMLPGNRLKILLLSLFVLLLAIQGFYCTPNNANTAPKSLWKNVYDTGAHYVGMQTCRTCHEPIYQTYIQTGMGQSFDHATRQKSAGDFDPKIALVYDTVLDYYYKPFWNKDSLYIMEFRLEGKDTVHKRVQKIDYIVGSGQHTNSHLFSINGYIYQAPITFYTQKHKWDLAPGFEKGANSRFQRMIESECMTCHNGYSDFNPESENKFASVKTGIDCERCHGPGSLHVAEKMSGKFVDTSKGPDYTIVNPRRLPTDLQNNVCQRCHLQGIATLVDQKTFYDFRPGMKLSEVENVFMPGYKGAQDKMIMASHVERMKKSRCYIESGSMSCISCHNPHVSVKQTPRQTFLNACLGCHAGKQECTEKPEVRAASNNDCVQCHMPHNSSIDIPHVAVTDHFIRKRPSDDTLQKQITAFLGMQCINNEDPGAIVRARGFLEFYERYTQSAGLLDSAMYYLNKVPDLELTKEHNTDLVRTLFWKGDYKTVTGFADTIQPEFLTDPWATYRIGESYYKQLQPEKALRWYERTIKLRKYALDFQYKYGICLLSVGGMNDAEKVFRFILAENPNYVNANTNLGYIELRHQRNDSAFYYFEKARKLDPDNMMNLLNLAVYYHEKGKIPETKKYLEHLIKKHPENQQAQAMLQDLGRH